MGTVMHVYNPLYFPDESDIDDDDVNNNNKGNFIHFKDLFVLQTYLLFFQYAQNVILTFI